MAELPLAFHHLFFLSPFCFFFWRIRLDRLLVRLCSLLHGLAQSESRVFSPVLLEVSYPGVWHFLFCVKMFTFAAVFPAYDSRSA